MFRRTALLLALLAPLALSGCVYYNTFYHAKIAAREAEALKEARAPGTGPGSREQELYERVAEKCTRVLRDHPESDWADDALLLLSRALYEQGKHESAQERLTEFVRVYPESRMRPEADYLLGAILIAKGDPVAAEDVLRAVADASPPTAFSDDALALIGEARHERERYDEAAEAYLAALDRFPDSERRAWIRFMAAENYADAGLLEEAAHHFAAIAAEEGGRDLAFEARIRLAEVRLGLEDDEAALAVLEDLERRLSDRDDLDRVLLLKGQALEQAGDIDAAASTYDGVSASHPRSDASALALYYKGLIERDRRDDMETALETFRKARDESSRSEGGQLASGAAQDIEKLKGYLDVIERAGSAGPDSVTARPDSPAEGQVPEEQTPWDQGPGAPADSLSARPDTTSVEPPAARRETESAQGDSIVAASDAAVEILTTEPAPADSIGTPAGSADLPPYTSALPPSVLAKGDSLSTEPVPAVPVTGSESPAAPPAPGPTEEELANARFLLAELYLFRMERPEKALDLYRDVTTHHAESPLAPKAALASAWILETRLNDAAGATEAYRAVEAGYPDTDYARAAREALERLGGVEVPGS